MHARAVFVLMSASMLACASDANDANSDSSASTVDSLATSGMTGETGDSNGSGDSTTTTMGDGDGEPTGDGDGDDDGFKFDVGPIETDLPTGEQCKVSDEGDAAGPCEESAPADAFAPVLQWSFTPDDGNEETLTLPLVANLTDDNDDGEIDLCDIPDVVMIAFEAKWGPVGYVYVLDGATGSLHYKIEQPVYWRGDPALGDIDDDGVPELLVQSDSNTIYCFEADGSLKWESPSILAAPHYGTGPAIALADIDTDGDVEIMFENIVLDHTGNISWMTDTVNGPSPATVAADLDGDDMMEIIHPTAAYRHDGSLYYDSSQLGGGFTAVANMDDDDDPEIVIAANSGLAVLEHDGSVKFSDLRPFGNAEYTRPPAVHDMDGDDLADFAVGSGSRFAVYDQLGAILWDVPVDDSSGVAGSTAFDFLGDNGAEAMYGDENHLWAFELGGVPVVQQSRSSATLIEYPVVVDVDNDGSAEIIVGSSRRLVLGGGEPNAYPTIQVFQDADDRWIQARRIWNQHTYHVTNVREDGTIPQFEPKHWLGLNTFRTNAQIEDGGVCDPVG